MVTKVDLPVEEQLARLYQHLGIRRAHLIACLLPDYLSFLRAHPEQVASLTLVCPRGLTREISDEIRCPLLVITGEEGPVSKDQYHWFTERPDRMLVVLPGYTHYWWSDVIADHAEVILVAIVDFIDRVSHMQAVEALALGEGEGEVEGITYDIHGSGQPLLLFPQALAPSQWEPLLPEFAQRWCTVALSGKALGFVSFLEQRGSSSGYLEAVGNIVRHAAIAPNEEILEVGCGTGVLMRWLAHQLDHSNRIKAVDINRHFLRNARSIARREGVDHKIDFREGHAEHLPFADNTSDVATSFTVLEEVDADRALAELVRVTRPGGRVAVLVRPVDMQKFINLSLPPDLKARLEAPGAWGASVGPKGCADATLYARMRDAGLVNVKRLPQVSPGHEHIDLQNLEANIMPLLSPSEADVWRAAADTAMEQGSFFLCLPYHGAVGTKP